MKREWLDYRRMTLPASLIKPSADDRLNMTQPFSRSGRRRGRRRRIFVIKQVRRSGHDQKIRRVLIFDNHPDSLRLVFGRHRAVPDVDRFLPVRRFNSGEVIVTSVAAIAVLFGILWPLLEMFAG
jgi:hypothetical protein